MMMNKYRQWHDAIIDRARNHELTGYFEKHHIIPRALGGGNSRLNIVRLTHREHFLVHWLLIKFTDGIQRQKMAFALTRMCHSRTSKHIVSGWQYEVARRALPPKRPWHGEKIKGRKHTSEARAKMRLAERPEKSAEHRQKLSMALMGRKYSEERRANISAALTGRKYSGVSPLKGRKRPPEFGINHSVKMKGRKFSAEHRANMSAAFKTRTISPETRAKISSTLTGRKRPDISIKLKGRKQTLESNVKRSASLRATFARRKKMREISASGISQTY